jgi:Zn-dependent peptidase ImmA (M78 family)
LPNGEIGRMASFDTIMWLFMRFCKEMNKRQKSARNPTLLSTSVRMETKSLKC